MSVPHLARGVPSRRNFFGSVLLLCMFSIGLPAGNGCGCDGDSFLRFPDPSVRYVAFGDSATKGPAERDYADFLADSLGSDAVAKEGNSGETSGEGLDRLRSLISRGLFPNAEALLYWEGGNDLTDMIKDLDPLLVLSPDSPNFPLADMLATKLDAIQANMETAITIGQESGWHVYVATYYFFPRASLDCDPMVLDILLPSQAQRANAYVTMLNERIRSAAAAKGATLVDVAAVDGRLRSDLANYANCNHLSASGNEIVAALFLQTIRSRTAGP